MVSIIAPATMTDEYFYATLEEPDLRYADHIRVLAHLIMAKRRDKHVAEANLMAMYLYKIIGRNQWNTVKDICDYHEWVTTNGSYVVGEKACTYRLDDQHVGKSKKFQIEDQSLAARVAAWWGDEEEEFKCRARALHRKQMFGRLLKFRDGLTLDRVDVRQMCLQETQIIKDWESYRYRAEREEVKEDFDVEKLAASREFAAQQIWEQNWKAKICDFGRYHWNVSSLWKELRPHLKYNGQPLVNIDVKTSQPVFFCLLILKELTKNGGVYREILQDPTHDSLSSIMIADSVIGSSQHPYLSRTYADLLESVFSDVRDFITHVVDPAHDIYDHLAELAGCGGDQRKVKKGDTFHILYGRNHQKTPYQIAMDTYYPNVMAFIRTYKKVEGVRIEKKKRHSVLAQDMQRAESDWMYDGVCKRLTKEHPEIPLFPIHDSIMTTPEHVETVSDVMYQELLRLGIRPQFGIEEYPE